MQRLRIATQLRSGLFGVIYVLDEPSAGLHPADAEPLLAVLDQLKSSGNSVFVVEHNMDVVRRADWLVDVGPRAGEGGGEVLYSGPVAGLAAVEASVTRPFLFPDGAGETADDDGGRRRAPAARRPAGWSCGTSAGTTCAELDADFPLGVLTAVTGVSGSGKSTLVSQVLAEVVGARLHPGPPDAADGHQTARTIDADDAELAGPLSVGPVSGLEQLDRLVKVDQKPIGRTPRSNLATYTGLFDAVRKEFAATDEAQRPRLRRRTVLLQRGRRPLRDLPGRGLRRRRTAVPARQLRPLPGMPRLALQPRNPGGHATAARTSPKCWA